MSQMTNRIRENVLGLKIKNLKKKRFNFKTNIYVEGHIDLKKKNKI